MAEIPRNPVLEELITAGKVQMAPGSMQDIYPSGVSDDVGRFIQQQIQRIKAKRTIEVGLGLGLSALYICDALAGVKGASHTAIDPFQLRPEFWNGAGVKHILKAGYKKLVRPIAEPSYLVLPRLIWAREKFDLAFIDGDHRFEFVFTDFFLLDKLLKPGGLVIFDDVNWPAIAKVCAFVERNMSYRPAGELAMRGSSNGDTLRCRVFEKIDSPQARNQGAFEDF